MGGCMHFEPGIVTPQGISASCSSARNDYSFTSTNVSSRLFEVASVAYSTYVHSFVHVVRAVCAARACDC